MPKQGRFFLRKFIPKKKRLFLLFLCPNRRCSDKKRQWRRQYGKVHFCDRRSCIGAWQRHRGGFIGTAFEAEGLQGGGAEVRPVYEHRPRHDESHSARRGVCHTRRSGNRP